MSELIATGICGFVLGVLIGIGLGYFRLAQWYRQHTGRSLWREVEEAKRDK